MMRAVLLLLGLVLLASGPAAGQGDKKDPKKARREPTIDGRTITAWVKTLEEADRKEKIKALTALIRVGPEARPAVPTLVKMLADPDPIVTPFCVPVLVQVGRDAVPALTKALESPKRELRAGAIFVLKEIREEARAAGTVLVKLLSAPEAEIRAAAAEALGAGGNPVALPSLRRALGDTNRGVAVNAACSLWKIDKDTAGGAVLVDACGGDDESLASRAVLTLAEMGDKAKPFAKGFMAALKNKSASVRLDAAPAAFLAGKADEAFAAVEAGLGDKEWRWQAIAALGRMKSSEKAVTRLERLLRDSETRTRRNAIAALAGDSSDLSGAKKSFAAGLDDPDDGVRWGCAVALLAQASFKIRGQEERFLSALWFHPSTPRGEAVREVAGGEGMGRTMSRVLTNHGGPIAGWVCRVAYFSGRVDSGLVPLLKTEDRRVRREAAHASRSLGFRSLPMLRTMLTDESSAARESAATALGSFGLPALSAVPDLLKRLRDADSNVRTQAAGAIWRIEGHAEEAVPVLKAVIKGVENKDRWEAMEVIGLMATDEDSPIPGLMEILEAGLKDRDEAVRVMSARWLWRKTKSGKAVLPVLRDAAKSRDELVRQSAVCTFGEIDVDGPVPLLLGALEDISPAVRVEAQEGLANIGDTAALVKYLGGAGKGRDGAARALGLMGPKAKEALPALAKAGPAGAVALRRIFPGRGKYLDAYLEAVRDGKDTKALEKTLLAGK